MDKKIPIDNEKTNSPPAGLQSIVNECLKIYPDQPNPLQVTTRLKYWYVKIIFHFFFYYKIRFIIKQKIL